MTISQARTDDSVKGPVETCRPFLGPVAPRERVPGPLQVPSSRLGRRQSRKSADGVRETSRTPTHVSSARVRRRLRIICSGEERVRGRFLVTVRAYRLLVPPFRGASVPKQARCFVGQFDNLDYAASTRSLKTTNTCIFQDPPPELVVYGRRPNKPIRKVNE